MRSVATLKRELDQLRQEVTVLREQVGLERSLRDLRSEVEHARSEVPKVPAIAARLEAGQTRLRREIAATKEKVNRVRVDQSLADYRLGELLKATEARAAGMEMKIETSISSFVIRDIHPDAGAALRNFAAEALKDNRTLYTTASTV
jgi:chromosome segregation ATPase